MSTVPGLSGALNPDPEVGSLVKQTNNSNYKNSKLDTHTRVCFDWPSLSNSSPFGRRGTWTQDRPVDPKRKTSLSVGGPPAPRVKQ